MDEVTGSSWPLWSIILLFAILGVLSILLIYSIAIYEPIPDYSYTHLTINLASPTLEERTIDDNVRWDAFITVNKITPRDEVLRWKEAYIVIKGSDGSTLRRFVGFNPNDPSVYDDATDRRIEIQAWYIKNTEHPNRVEATDQIIITGLNEAYEGCTILILREEYQYASLTLPTDFE